MNKKEQTNHTLIYLKLLKAAKENKPCNIKVLGCILPDNLSKVLSFEHFNVIIKAKNSTSFPEITIWPTKVTKKYVNFSRIEFDLPDWLKQVLKFVDWKKKNQMELKNRLYIKKIYALMEEA